MKRTNGCESEGTQWAKDCTRFDSAKGAPFIAYIHEGTHKYPPQAPPLIVRFFQEFGQ